ncbi:MAG: ferrous iron transporter B [Ruminococcaceae bacterium]|nr:ferrous iron transporter B [Oscillospiraceae bacterium]
MSIKIALAGNPNSGKTTLFNALTGSNQYVGNWPGVTVEKKEGKLKKHSDVIITDLPGIYSLSPYTIEEVVARDYLIDEKPDAIINIVDGTNLERNLYLTTQLVELGIPVVVAVNMMDIVKKNGDKINCEELSRALACPVVEISALKGTGIDAVVETAIKASEGKAPVPQHSFSGVVEHALAHIEERLLHDMPAEQQRWYAVKLFESDEKVIEKLKISESDLEHISEDIKAAEDELDDDAESIITNERYVYIGTIIKSCCKKANKGKLTTSDKIDKIVTNRILGLPIFAVIMLLVYTVSMAPSAFGTGLTDWANDGLFGDGWHLTGKKAYEEAVDGYADEYLFSNEEFNAVLDKAVNADIAGADKIKETVEDGSWADFEEQYGFYGDSLAEEGYDLAEFVDTAMGNEDEEIEPAGEIPAAEDFGVWVPGVPVLVGKLLEKIGAGEFATGLILDGIVAGVGAVLGFVPQMLVLFLCLAFLEGCGYMARVAFIMDRVFRKFGLSGKSFIPVLVGTGCGVPGIMASRTIENERDRRMTIMTTTFIPCGAKLPIITMIAVALFHGSPLVATSAYFIGIAAIICSGILLKKTKMFAGDPAPFVMELPAYHLPTVGTVLRSTWERGWSFIKRAGTVILLSSIFIWLGSVFGTGTESGGFGFNPDMELEDSVLGMIGNVAKIIFAPLGFGTGTAGIKATIATVMGLVAKEEVVGVFGVLDFEGLTKLAAYSFLLFNLLCAPCFAAIGAIKREMNSAKWTWFAIGYQCGLAYAVSLCVYQIGSIFTGNLNVIGLVFALAVLAGFLYLLFRKNRYNENHLTVSVKK